VYDVPLLPARAERNLLDLGESLRETNVMYEKSGVCRKIWLRTDRSVVPTNTADWHHLLTVQNALHQGVFAIADAKRPEFYEIEIEDHWYYIHIPSRIGGVYLIAANRKPWTTRLIRQTVDQPMIA
jgi:hypothetical protein